MRRGSRRCVVCKEIVYPSPYRTGLTTHEFNCLLTKPEYAQKLTQDMHEKYVSLLNWKKRSDAAKKAAEKRKLMRS